MQGRADNMCRQPSTIQLSPNEQLAAEETFKLHCKPVELCIVIRKRAIDNVCIYVISLPESLLLALLFISFHTTTTMQWWLAFFCIAASFSTKMPPLHDTGKPQKEVALIQIPYLCQKSNKYMLLCFWKYFLFLTSIDNRGFTIIYVVCCPL